MKKQNSPLTLYHLQNRLREFYSLEEIALEARKLMLENVSRYGPKYDDWKDIFEAELYNKYWDMYRNAVDYINTGGTS